MSNCTVYCLYISGDNILIDKYNVKIYYIYFFMVHNVPVYYKAVAKEMNCPFSLGFIGIYAL